jgi:flagellin-like protein
MKNVRNTLIKYLTDQRGITGLETAIVLIAFVVVASVFAFTVLTTGLFTSEEAKNASVNAISSTESTLMRIGEFVAGGPCAPRAGGPADQTLCDVQSYTIDWTGCDIRDSLEYPVDDLTCSAHAQLFRFKLSPAGETPVGFDPTTIVITWFDTGSGIEEDPPVSLTVLFDKEIVAPNDIDGNLNPLCDGSSKWCYRWQEGETDKILDPGEYVEIFITGVSEDLHMTMRDSEIVVEVITPDGAVLQIQGRMPGVIRQTMSLDR